jgi:hypothetical protein
MTIREETAVAFYMLDLVASRNLSLFLVVIFFRLLKSMMYLSEPILPKCPNACFKFPWS